MNKSLLVVIIGTTALTVPLTVYFHINSLMSGYIGVVVGLTSVLYSIFDK